MGKAEGCERGITENEAGYLYACRKAVEDEQMTECKGCIILKAMNDELKLRIAQLEQELEEGNSPDKGDIDGRD
jgi:hypothetical protein